MRIAVFTSNQPRHLALLEALTGVADDLFVVMESTTLKHGTVADFYPESPAMAHYFQRVLQAEHNLFGSPRYLPVGPRVLGLRMGDLNLLPLDTYAEALTADLSIVFGSSYIKGPLAGALIDRGAINIHMGISPYYRGSSTNFWAAYDRRFDLIGATIHRLSNGIDSGDILFHALPRAQAVDAFQLGMLSVRAAIETLVGAVRDGSLPRAAATPQDHSKEIRYTRNRDFNDEIVENYLGNLASPEEVQQAVLARRPGDFVRPVIA